MLDAFILYKFIHNEIYKTYSAHEMWIISISPGLILSSDVDWNLTNLHDFLSALNNSK